MSSEPLIELNQSLSLSQLDSSMEKLNKKVRIRERAHRHTYTEFMRKNKILRVMILSILGFNTFTSAYDVQNPNQVVRFIVAGLAAAGLIVKGLDELMMYNKRAINHYKKTQQLNSISNQLEFDRTMIPSGQLRQFFQKVLAKYKDYMAGNNDAMLSACTLKKSQKEIEKDYSEDLEMQRMTTDLETMVSPVLSSRSNHSAEVPVPSRSSTSV